MNTYIWKVLQKSEREKIHKEVQITHTQLDFEYDLVTLHSVVNLLSKICWSGKTPPPNETGSSLRVGIWTYCHTITPCPSLLQTYVNSTLTCFPKLGFRTNSKLHSLYFELYFVTQDTYRLKMSDKVEKYNTTCFFLIHPKQKPAKNVISWKPCSCFKYIQRWSNVKGGI